jgi:hypothetical protein
MKIDGKHPEVVGKRRKYAFLNKIAHQIGPTSTSFFIILSYNVSNFFS